MLMEKSSIRRPEEVRKPRWNKLLAAESLARRWANGQALVALMGAASGVSV